MLFADNLCPTDTISFQLHTGPLGIGKTHTTYLGIKYGSDMWNTLNERVIDHTDYPSLTSLPHGILEPSDNTRGLQVVPTTGGEMKSYQNISLTVLRG